MATDSTCPACGQPLSEPGGRCDRCEPPTRHKTAKEAYFSLGGLGLFDLIPGVRNLPYPIRFVIMIVVVAAAVLVVVPFVVRSR